MPTFGSTTTLIMGVGALVAAGVIGGIVLLDPDTPQSDETMVVGATEASQGAGPAATRDAEEPEAATLADATAAGARCPEDMMRIAANQGGVEACGTGRPPAMGSHPLDGIWDIEAPGNPKVDAVTLFMHSNYGILHRGDPNNRSPAHAAWRLQGEGRSRQFESAVQVPVDDDGTARISIGQFEFSMRVTLDFLARPTADPDVMIGEWSYSGRSKGVSIWRRRSSAAVVERVGIWSGTYDDADGWQEDVFAYGARPGRLQRWHPVGCGAGATGNCRVLYVSVYGEDFAGAHDVWIDPATRFEIDEASWICSNGETERSAWSKCGLGDFPGDTVAGIQIRFEIKDGATSRPIILWVDGQPIPIDFVINDQPEEDAAPDPALVLLDALNTAGEQITQVDEGMPFQVKAHYDAPHPDDWVSLALPELSRELVLFRTQDPRVFQSDWLAVAEDER